MGRRGTEHGPHLRRVQPGPGRGWRMQYMQVPGRCSRTAVSHTKSTREGHAHCTIIFTFIVLWASLTCSITAQRTFQFM